MKCSRELDIFIELLKGEKIKCKNIAEKYEVSERTVQRDIKNLKEYLLDKSDKERLNLSLEKIKNEYLLKGKEELKFTTGETLAICKILLDSRAFKKSEMDSIINKILKNRVYSESENEIIKELITSEKNFYVELNHKKPLFERIALLGEVIKTQKKIRIKYRNIYKEESTKVICPLSLMFSEFYFYLLTRDENSEKVEYKRVDRIEEIEVLNENFRIEYTKRLEDGEIRKIEQFMTRGEIRKLKMVYRGGLKDDIPEFIRDKFPTLKEVGKTEDGKTIFEVTVLGWGIDLWLYGQDDRIEVREEKIIS